MASLNSMVKSVAGLVYPNDINAWEKGFIESLVQKTRNGDNTTMLTEKQIDRLTELYDKHVAS